MLKHITILFSLALGFSVHAEDVNCKVESRPGHILQVALESGVRSITYWAGPNSGTLIYDSNYLIRGEVWPDSCPVDERQIEDGIYVINSNCFVKNVDGSSRSIDFKFEFHPQNGGSLTYPKANGSVDSIKLGQCAGASSSIE